MGVHVRLNGGISTGVEDLARDDFSDGCGGLLLQILGLWYTFMVLFSKVGIFSEARNEIEGSGKTPKKHKGRQNERL